MYQMQFLNENFKLIITIISDNNNDKLGGRGKDC